MKIVIVLVYFYQLMVKIQLYIFDISNKIFFKKIFSIMNREGKDSIDTQILSSLIKIIDEIMY